MIVQLFNFIRQAYGTVSWKDHSITIAIDGHVNKRFISNHATIGHRTEINSLILSYVILFMSYFNI